MGSDIANKYTLMREEYLTRVEEMIGRIEKHNDGVDRKLILDSYHIAFNAHKGVYRDDKVTPYIEHPVEVAEILSELKVDDITLSAALLHDVVEDTIITGTDIKRKYGETISSIVEGLTKDKQKFDSVAEKQSINFEKLLKGMIKELRVIIIKMADRVHNMKTLGPLSYDRKSRIANETKNIFSPLANRLGMHKFKLQLDDSIFMSLEPDRFREIKESVDRYEFKNRSRVDKTIKVLEDALLKVGIKAKVSVNKRSYSSIAEKIEYNSFDDSKKYFSIKVIALENANMYNVLEQVHRLFKPLNQVSDYIASPKSNGYQSIHTKVRTDDGYVYEFLIRSRLMDEMAEYGLIHLIYNMDTDSNSALKTYVSSIKDLYNDSYSNKSDHGETLDNIKSNLVTDQVYIYTPTNEVHELPKGSSVLDFAYKVHSELGNHCIASKVNGKTRPISFKLRNHDVVQVMTSETQLPKEDWLDFIITSKASKQIKLALKKKYEDTDKQRKSFLSKFYIFRKGKRDGKEIKKVRNIEILTKFYPGLISKIDKEIRTIDKLISMDLKIENDTVITLIKAEFVDQKSFDRFMLKINSFKYVINVFEFK